MFDSIKKLIKEHLTGPKIDDIYQEYFYQQKNLSPWQKDRLSSHGLVKIIDMKCGWIRYQSIDDGEIQERKISTFLNIYVFYKEGAKNV